MSIIDKGSLEILIACGLSQKEIGQVLACSKRAVQTALDKHELKTQITPTQAHAKDQEICSRCGESDPNNFYSYNDGRPRYKCKTCISTSGISRQRQRKQDAVTYKGGKCVRCGYNKCLRSLVFHHMDPARKDINWSNMRRWGMADIKRELDKCMLVCSNCHGEIHAEIDNDK